LRYNFGHLKTVYFAGPGGVEELFLNPLSHVIIVNWEKPSLNSDCVRNYIIKWVNTVSGSSRNTSVLSEKDSFIIEHLDACVDYAVSVTAVNAYDVGDKAVTRNATTVIAGNCQTHIILLCL
jgi:hypothetical protein